MSIKVQYNFYWKMIDFSRTFCDLHPNELISNFCSRQQCNVGLCATCICSHTETHILKRTAPDYENIRTTYSKMQEQIRTRISALEQQKQRIQTLVEHIHSTKQHTYDTIHTAKQETLDFVNRFFDEKEKDITRRIEAEQKKQGLHNENRMDTLNNTISRDINALYAAATDLNSNNFLQSFHRIRTQVLTNSQQTQREVSEQLDKNQNYDVALSINPTLVNEIKNALQKSLIFCWTEKQPTIKLNEPKEDNNNRSSRILINQNQNSAVTTLHRRPESMPKQSFSSQPGRSPSSYIEQFNPMAFLKQQDPQIIYQAVQRQSQCQPQSQPQIQYQQQQPLYQYQPQPQQQLYQVKMQPQPYLNNNSTPFPHGNPLINSNSRIELRPNSSQKNIKENSFLRNPLSQSFMGSSIHTGEGQLDATKKIRRSGLTVLRSVDNQSKH